MRSYTTISLEASSKSGLEFKHLKAVYQRSEDGQEGVRTLLQERFHGLIRVTNNKKVVSNITMWLAKAQTDSVATPAEC